MPFLCYSIHALPVFPDKYNMLLKVLLIYSHVHALEVMQTVNCFKGQLKEVYIFLIILMKILTICMLY